MAARTIEYRRHERFTVSLRASVQEDPPRRGRAPFPVRIISISEEGCAFRTATRLTAGDRHLLRLSVGRGDAPVLRCRFEVVWGCDDFRIDTFYRYGARLAKPLASEELRAVLAAESLALELTGPLFQAAS